MNTYTRSLSSPVKATPILKSTLSAVPRSVLHTVMQLNGLLILLVILALTACASWLTVHDPLDMAGMPLLRPWQDAAHWRSEEHTSELQSRGHLVCRLLLDKKKNKRSY